MEKKWNGLKWMVITIILSVFLVSCAALQKNDVTDVEGLLTQAGFKKRLADTPQKLAHLKTLAQRKLALAKMSMVGFG